MISRAIHMIRSLFDVMFDPKRIPDNAIVEFTDQIANFYTPIIIGGTTLYINQIIYNSNTHTFDIITSANTYNDFILYWAVCLRSCNSNQMPCFSVIVKKEDNSIFTTLPSNGVKKTGVVYGSAMLHLPTPSPEESQVKYRLSLVNQTGDDCFYSARVYSLAEMLIVCIDDP